MPANLADMHCHLELFENVRELASSCHERDIRVLAVTSSPRSWLRFGELIDGYDRVRPALGLHPQLGDALEPDLPLFEKLLPGSRYVGEIGLDAGRDFVANTATQTRVLRRVLRMCSEQRGKILSVHSVRAAADVVRLLESDFDFSTGRVILHWFTGTAAVAKRAAELGCYFSVNTQMMRSESGMKIVQALPIERLLTETDGPFVLERGRPATPLGIIDVVRSLAVVRGVEIGALNDQLATNLRTLVTL